MVKSIDLLFEYFSEESVENVLTTIEKQIQFLRRREIQGQKFVQNLQKTIDHLQQNLSAEQTAKETALKDKEAAVTRYFLLSLVNTNYLCFAKYMFLNIYRRIVVLLTWNWLVRIYVPTN